MANWKQTARATLGSGLALLLGLGHVPAAFAQAAAAAAQAQAAAATPSPPPSAVEDLGWPRQITRDGAELIYYQPQLDAWKDYKTLACRLAFTVTPRGGQPVPGVASISANTLVDNEARTVFLRDIRVTSVRFPSSDPETARQMELLFRTLVPSGGEPIALDRLTAMLTTERAAPRTAAVNNEPPPIFYSAAPAILLMVDGEPALAPVEKTNLEFVVNTNFDLFRDKASKKYFLLAPGGWLGADDPKGPWAPSTELPADFAKLPADQNFDDVKKAVPAKAYAGAVPQVLFSNAPAELILLRGAPVYAKIPGTQLLYVTNTDNDVFVDNASRQFYVLLSGRWFKSENLGGPFTYASASLPADFLKIPAGSPKVGVRVAVPGTQEAADAVLLAQIPTTAVINKAEAEAQAKVSYDGGKPQFQAIEGTTVKYATNTEGRVLQVGNAYYLCYQGVWFVASTPNGPWKVADSVPAAIYTIPPSSPVYNVTYVTQTNATSTTVESSHTAGYFGTFVVGMSVGFCIAYGTGWRYPPYYYRPPGAYYPVYRPYPRSYGVAASYNPRTGNYAVGRAAYGPYGSVSGAASYNPSTGRYGRAASVQTPYGGRTAASSYNPWTGGYARTQQGHNAYSQWGSSVATRGNQWVQTGHVTTAGGTTAGYRTSSGQSGVVRKGDNGTVVRSDNGVYAGRDGNVYKRDSQGQWSQYDKGNWNKVDRSAAQTQGLDSSAQDRQRGQADSQRNRVQSTPATRPETRSSTPRPETHGSTPRAEPRGGGAGARTPRAGGGGGRRR
ncbi:MAG TPA: hypothetical protein VGQ57_16065 [Polyangiaceae bacterium]|nr:hypothetical protein [Polyangiaceae bacterium]